MRLVCWACGEREEGLQPGWAIRTDHVVAACPEHVKFMPPHPKGLEHEYIELGSPFADADV